MQEKKPTENFVVVTTKFSVGIILVVVCGFVIDDKQDLIGDPAFFYNLKSLHFIPRIMTGYSVDKAVR